jgi:hypothetical protein
MPGWPGTITPGAGAGGSTGGVEMPAPLAIATM